MTGVAKPSEVILDQQDLQHMGDTFVQYKSIQCNNVEVYGSTILGNLVDMKVQQWNQALRNCHQATTVS